MKVQTKIVAIGGGEIGRPGYPMETISIDKEIIKLSGKKNPKLLFIPTASSDSESYYEVVKKYFGKKLGCKTDVLYLLKNKISKEEIQEKIFGTDIVYVGGGNTLEMLKVWKKFGIDKILKQAHKKGIILSGVSAGSVCWFKYGNSDSKKMVNPSADYIKISGLGLISALNCPHYNIEIERKPSLKNMMKKIPVPAIAIDNCCALEIVDGRYRVISSKSKANAYKVFWKNGKFFENKIQKKKEFLPLLNLLKI